MKSVAFLRSPYTAEGGKGNYSRKADEGANDPVKTEKIGGDRAEGVNLSAENTDAEHHRKQTAKALSGFSEAYFNNIADGMGVRKRRKERGEKKRRQKLTERKAKKKDTARNSRRKAALGVAKGKSAADKRRAQGRRSDKKRGGLICALLF